MSPVIRHSFRAALIAVRAQAGLRRRAVYAYRTAAGYVVTTAALRLPLAVAVNPRGAANA